MVLQLCLEPDVRSFQKPCHADADAQHVEFDRSGDSLSPYGYGHRCETALVKRRAIVRLHL